MRPKPPPQGLICEKLLQVVRSDRLIYGFPIQGKERYRGTTDRHSPRSADGWEGVRVDGEWLPTRGVINGNYIRY